MARPTPFWVVWNPDHGSPTVKHETRIQAQAEAERLAWLTPGGRFYVLMALSVTQKSDVTTTDFDISDFDGIPF